ncbi:MAG: hypothetical protein HQL34_03890 [Alphaproteobacteria bacterium]|nr:hypothetical protein [Alphaproteobacteria bacterium]
MASQNQQKLNAKPIFPASPSTPVASRVTVNSRVMAAGQAISASSLFSVKSATGNTVQKYVFKDMDKGGGYFVFNGKKYDGEALEVSAADLRKVSYVSGKDAAANRIEVGSFNINGAYNSITGANGSGVITTVTENVAPVVTAISRSLNAGTTINATSLFSYSDLQGSNTVTRFRLTDVSANGGYFILGGKRIDGASIELSRAEVSKLTYVTGDAASKNTFKVAVMDKEGAWSQEVSGTVNVLVPVVSVAPSLSVTVKRQTVDGLERVALSDLVQLSTSSNVKSLTIRDLAIGKGHLEYNGKVIDNGSITLSSLAELKSVTYVGDTTLSSQNLRFQIQDTTNKMSNTSLATIKTVPANLFTDSLKFSTIVTVQNKGLEAMVLGKSNNDLPDSKIHVSYPISLTAAVVSDGNGFLVDTSVISASAASYKVTGLTNVDALKVNDSGGSLYDLKSLATRDDVRVGKDQIDIAQQIFLDTGRSRVAVTMESSLGEVRTGLLGDIFKFSNLGDGSRPVTIKARYTMSADLTTTTTAWKDGGVDLTSFDYDAQRVQMASGELANSLVTYEDRQKLDAFASVDVTYKADFGNKAQGMLAAA